MSLNNSGNNQSNTKIQSFLESLRASRGNSPKTDRTEDRPFNNPFKELQAKKEIEKRRVELFHQARQQEWNSVYSSKERETSQKIEQIRAQLTLLAKQVKTLDKNLQKAIESPVVDSGAYHESYLIHIQKMIQLFSLKVNSANSWLQVYSSRSIKKGYYHQMAKSKGSSFTQNNERTIATSVG